MDDSEYDISVLKYLDETQITDNVSLTQIQEARYLSNVPFNYNGILNAHKNKRSTHPLYTVLTKSLFNKHVRGFNPKLYAYEDNAIISWFCPKQMKIPSNLNLRDEYDSDHSKDIVRSRRPRIPIICPIDKLFSGSDKDDNFSTYFPFINTTDRWTISNQSFHNNISDYIGEMNVKEDVYCSLEIGIYYGGKFESVIENKHMMFVNDLLHRLKHTKTIANVIQVRTLYTEVNTVRTCHNIKSEFPWPNSNLIFRSNPDLSQALKGYYQEVCVRRNLHNTVLESDRPWHINVSKYSKTDLTNKFIIGNDSKKAPVLEPILAKLKHWATTNRPNSFQVVSESRFEFKFDSSNIDWDNAVHEFKEPYIYIDVVIQRVSKICKTKKECFEGKFHGYRIQIQPRLLYGKKVALLYMDPVHIKAYSKIVTLLTASMCGTWGYFENSTNSKNSRTNQKTTNNFNHIKKGTSETQNYQCQILPIPIPMLMIRQS